MNAEKVGNWLQISANIGILLGLLLVGIQISENTKIARADLISRTFEIANQYTLAMLGENPSEVIARIDPSSPDEADLAVLQAELSFWHNFDTRYELLLNEGLADPSIWHNYLDIHARTIFGGSPLRRQLWEEMTAEGLDMEWEKFVDTHLSKTE